MAPQMTVGAMRTCTPTPKFRPHGAVCLQIIGNRFISNAYDIIWFLNNAPLVLK